jgi:hypothetical protein
MTYARITVEDGGSRATFDVSDKVELMLTLTECRSCFPYAYIAYQYMTPNVSASWPYRHA